MQPGMYGQPSMMAGHLQQTNMFGATVYLRDQKQGNDLLSFQ